MIKRIGSWFEIHEDEIGLFLWTCLLLFLVRSSGILLNNYAETAFLKRFGVEYLPIVNMIKPNGSGSGKIMRPANMRTPPES